LAGRGSPGGKIAEMGKPNQEEKESIFRKVSEEKRGKDRIWRERNESDWDQILIDQETEDEKEVQGRRC